MTDVAGLSYYEIILDSRDASNKYDPAYTSLDYPSFDLGGKLQLQKIAYMKVIEASIPFTYYTVNSDNNAITLSDSSGVFSITLAPGTYSPSAMIAELTAKFAATPTIYTYTVTYNPADLSFSVFNGAAVSNPFTITFSLGRDTLGVVLGFPQGAQTSQTFNAGAGGNRLAGGASELLGTNFLYVNSNAIGNEMDMFLPVGSSQFGNGGPQMAVIPTEGLTFGDDFHYQDPAPTLWYDMRDIESLTKMDLFITDGGSQRILKFNGRGYMIKLGVLLADKAVEHGTITTGSLQIRKRQR
jgi:hypothetical protein